jgi:septum formation protein
MRFILASGSPARLATLRAAGVEPEVLVSGVDEDSIRATSVARLVTALAEVKARAVVRTLLKRSAHDTALILGCDSLLELDGVALGKPGTAIEATTRWQQMRGRTAQLHTGHALLAIAHGETTHVSVKVATTSVTFADVTDEEIVRYVGTGEPLQVAGAFTIDGLGGWFIERVEGDHHNVVGLSLPLLRLMLAEVNVSVTDLPGTG